MSSHEDKQRDELERHHQAQRESASKRYQAQQKGEGTSNDETRATRKMQTTMTEALPNLATKFFGLQWSQTPYSDEYATALSYDPVSNSVLFTGNTRQKTFDQADCMLNNVALGNLPAYTNPLKVVAQRIYGTPISETCTAVSAEDQGGDAVLLGFTSAGGLMTNLARPGSVQATVYGYAIDVNVISGVGSSSGPSASGDDGSTMTERAGNSSVPSFPGILFHQTLVDYPIAIDSFANGDVAVVMMSSKYGGTNDIVPVGIFGETYDINNYPVHGKDFEMWVGRLSRDGGLTSKWQQNLATRYGHSVFVSDVKVIMTSGGKEIVVVAGSTAGIGAAFGAGVQSTSNTDLDGFITKFDAQTGQLLGYDASHPLGNGVDLQATYSRRIASQPNVVDFTAGICVTVNSQDPNGAIYVVGSTLGKLDPDFVSSAGGDYTAFIRKMELDTLNVLWTKQIDGYRDGNGVDVRGGGCAVTNNGKALYVAGVVTNSGAVLDQVTAGGDDIFVAFYETVSGDLQFIRQTGSPAQDQLAKQNPVLADRDGHAIFLGTTAGKIASNVGGVSGNSDAFVLQMYNPDAEPFLAGTVGSSSEALGLPFAAENKSTSAGVPKVAMSAVSISFCLAIIFAFVSAYYVRMKRRERRQLEEARAKEPHMIGQREPDFDEFSFDMASIHDEGLTSSIGDQTGNSRARTKIALDDDDAMSADGRSNYGDLVSTYSNYVIDDAEEEEDDDDSDDGTRVV